MARNREINLLLDYVEVENKKKNSSRVVENMEVKMRVNSASGSLINILIGQIRDMRNIRSDVEYLIANKSKIIELSLRRRKEIENLMGQKNRTYLSELLDLYNTSVFIKTSINILEQDVKYKRDLLKCRKYFLNDASDIYEYLYWNDDVNISALSRETKKDMDSIYRVFLEHEELVKKKRKEDETEPSYSLSLKGKELYSLYKSEYRNIATDETRQVQDEDKLNEVLEFLIQYAQDKKEPKFRKAPVLRTARARENFAKLKSLIDGEKGYKYGSIIDELYESRMSKIQPDYAIVVERKKGRMYE